MKRHFATALGVIVSAASLFIGGCGGYDGEEIIIKDKAPAKSEVTDLRLFGYKTDSSTLFSIEKTFTSFLENNANLNVVYEGIKESEYYTAFDKRCATGNLSDAFMVNGETYRALKSQNKLADLSDSVDVNSFIPAVKEQITEADGKVYFVPGSVSTYNLYVNYGLLQRENLSVPTNYTEFKAACNHFAAKGVIPLIIDTYYSLTSLIEAKGLYSVYQSSDTSAKLAAFNDNPLLMYDYLSDGIDLVSEMIDGKWIDRIEGLNTKQAEDEIDLFVKGDRPFMIASGQVSQKVKDRVSAENPHFNYGIHPYPVLSDGAVLAIDLDTCIAVNGEGANIADTKKLVSFMSKPSAIYDYSESQNCFMPLNDCKIPSDAALVPSYDFYVSGKTVVQSDYRLAVEDFEDLVYDCGSKLLYGESKEEVKAYLKTELILRGGREI